jgi:hypothetical protein
VQEQAPVWMDLVRDSGGRWHESLARYDRATCSWKTRQCSLLAGSESFSETWPRWGLMLDGVSWALTMPALPTGGSGSGLWPTPVADGDRTVDYKQGGRSLGAEVRRYATPTATANQLCPSMQKHPGCRAMWPTPRASESTESNATIDARRARGHSCNDNLTAAIERADGERGSLNPVFVEWLMGWPRDWTDITIELSDPDLVADWSGEWEGVPRAAANVPRRADRLRALGNGQVPACAALAWRVLTS